MKRNWAIVRNGILAIATVSFVSSAYADEPPPGPPGGTEGGGGGHGLGGNQGATGVPIGDGWTVLIGLAVFYAAIKNLRNEKKSLSITRPVVLDKNNAKPGC